MRHLRKNFLHLALPSVVTNITVPLLSMADTAIAGHLGRAEYIGAIAIGGTVFNMIYWVFAFLRMGTTGVVAQAVGQSDGQKADHTLRRALLWALSISLAIILLQRPILWVAMLIMHPDESTAFWADTYFSICVWGAPAMLAQYALTGWFIGRHETRYPMLTAISQNLINIAVSCMLVFAFGWKIEGVAVGTLTAQWCGLFIALILTRRLYPSPRTENLRTRNGSEKGPSLMRVNSDIFLRTLCMVAVTVSFTAVGSRQGELILAANALLMQFFIIYSYFTDGLANAIEALSGRFAGGGRSSMLQLTIRDAFIQGLIIALVFTALYMLLGHSILRLFTDLQSVQQVAEHFMPWACAIPLVALPAMVWDGVFIGLTLTRGMLWSSFLAMLVFATCLCLLFSTIGNHALWLAFLSYLFTRGIVQSLIFRRNKIC